MLQDSLGNTIQLKESAGTCISNKGLQITLQSYYVAGVTWQNLRTKKIGVCTGTNQWSADGIELYPGENKIVVTASSADGKTGVGALDVTYQTAAEQTIGLTKQLPEEAFVSLLNQAVTAGNAEMGDCFYIESSDRSGGIKVTGASAATRDVVTIDGNVKTINGEREILASSLIKVTCDPKSIKPLAMNNLALGGGKTGLQEGVLNTKTETTVTGLNNIGLLIKTWGKFKYKDSSTFFIDNGSGEPVKCVVPSSVWVDPAWQYVIVTGISSCEKDSDKLYRLLRVRNQQDIVVDL